MLRTRRHVCSVALHFQKFIEYLKSCPIHIAYGQSGSGKTTTLSCGLSLLGADNVRFFQDLSNTATFLVNGGRMQYCANCLMSDHSQAACTPIHHQGPGDYQRPGDYQSEGKETARDQASMEDTRVRERRATSEEEAMGDCFSWNEGRCSSRFD